MNQQPVFKQEGANLKFGEEVFRKGQNYTVRYGKDYAIAREIEVGMYLQLLTVGGEFISDAQITHITVCRLMDIPKDVFSNEHDPECKNPIVLYDEMVKCYPDVEWTKDVLVTCIGFKPI